MKKENKRIEKLCGFYVSDWHLVTMLLPYINHKIDENVKVITILENNIQENIKTLVEKLNLKNQNEILSIKWENTITQKYSDIEEKLEKETNQKQEHIIILNGSKNYIEKNNCNIEKWFQKSKIKTLKVINFFEVAEFNYHITDILDAHDKVLNTSGEKEIQDVFEGYVKNEKVAGNA